MPTEETAIPTTVEELDAAGARGMGAGFKRVYPDLYAHILHAIFDGNSSAAEEYLASGHDVVAGWWRAKGLIARGKDRPRRNRNSDRDYEMTGAEVWELWGEQPLEEYAEEYTWKVPRGHEMVSLVCLSDLHAQSRLFDKNRLASTIEYIREDPRRRWVCAGDLFTNASKQSVGSLSHQTVDIEAAIRGLTFGLKPIANKCIGIAHGNHDARIQNKLDLNWNPVRNLCQNLEVPYLGYMKHLVLHIGSQRYTVYIHHGTSGAATPGGRLNAGLKVMGTVVDDLTIIGHLHDEMQRKAIRRGPADDPDEEGRIPIVDYKQHLVMCASFERYGDWPQERALPPTPLGSCRIEFSGKTHDWRVVS